MYILASKRQVHSVCCTKYTPQYTLNSDTSLLLICKLQSPTEEISVPGTTLDGQIMTGFLSINYITTEVKLLSCNHGNDAVTMVMTYVQD